MSLITDQQESPRDCSRKHHQHGGSRRWRKKALIAASSTVVSLLSLAVILWLTLRPSSPHFSLLAATATASASNNASSSSSTVMVINAVFTASNPNAHAAALYDELRASASYAGVPLGVSLIPPLEQPQGDVVMSASPPWTTGVAEGGPPVLLRARIEGQLRWKVATWVSGRHALSVDCVAVVAGSSSSQSQCATHVVS
jgi:hypothetical protein